MGIEILKFIMDTTEYSKDKSEMSITMKVHEGEQYKYRNFTWEECPFLMNIN